MKSFIATTLVTIAAIVGSVGTAAASSTQPYIWTNGEAGLIANPAYQATPSTPDKSAGLYIVGVGENGLVLNPAFAKLPNMKHQALFTVGVGEVGLIEIKNAPIVMASK
jgi:hypothetical protein